MTINDWLDPRVLVAVYAALVSTAALVWNILLLIINNKKSLVVKNNMLQSFSDHPVLGQSDVVGLWGFEITNTGKTDLYIKSAGVYFCKKKVKIMGIDADGLTEYNREAKIKFPILLKKGEVFKSDYGIAGLVEAVKNQLKDADKLQIRVYDTLGKKYYSKKIKLGKLKEQLEISDSVNQRNA